MIESLQITGYRVFEDFKFENLARVNLLVGKNNCGKTTALEAIRLLASGGDPGVFLSTIASRGEHVLVKESDGRRDREVELDPGYMFRNHVMEIGSSFRIRAHNSGIDEIEWAVVKAPRREPPVLVAETISITGSRLKEPREVPLTFRGGIDAVFVSRDLRSAIYASDSPPTVLVPAESLNVSSLAEMWDDIALTDDEREVLEALRILDSRIERMAFLAGTLSGPRRKNAGIVLKLSGFDRRMPLGSVGEGMRRILALALAAIRSREGVLLVDEIDTGLHYSSLADMWRLMIRTAQRMNSQVFATTHSQDCVNALAWLCEKEPELAGEASLHRIELDSPHSISYTAPELAEAARRHIEVR